MSYIDSEEISRLDYTDSSDSDEKSDNSIGNKSSSTNQNKRKLIREENVRTNKNKTELSIKEGKFCISKQHDGMYSRIILS